MLPEIAILRFILIYTNYIKYYKYIKINKEAFKELDLIYRTLTLYFESHPSDTTVDDFSVFFFSQYPRLKPEELNAYSSIFEQARSSTVTEESAISLVSSLRQRYNAYEIALRALSVSEGRSPPESLTESYEEWWVEDANEIVAPTTAYVSDDLEQLRSETISTPGLRWRLNSVNKALGSLRKGDFGVVFARPETGKTTFLASEITYMASQTDSPILWFNNEEQGNKVKIRCFQAALGAPLEVLFGDTAGNQREYDRLTGRRIKIYDSGTIFKTEVERIIEEVKPALVVFDQLDKVRGFNADRNDLVMGAIYQWGRGIAKEVCPVIGVCQADGTGEGVKYLTMSNVAEAKTSKQAEADWILGIGRSYDDTLQQVRHFCLSKNKLMGDMDSDPQMRHGRWDVFIDADTARYRDL